jgi:arsenite methyltransferase
MIVRKETLMKDKKKIGDKKIKGIVRERYADIAKQNTSCCAQSESCCDSSHMAEHIGKAIGYSKKELQSVPENANLGLGCGNPVALASLKEGETILDLGAGAGFDCFLATNRVGKKGKVIGVDMTPEMVAKAKDNARMGQYENVEFKLGEIEKLPVETESVDVVISNCVINLSPDKKKVFQEAFRVLKPGGRLMVSDLVLLKDLPASIKESVQAYTGCIAGAMRKEKYINLIKETGFQKVDVQGEEFFSIGLGGEDALAKAIAEEAEIPMEQLHELARSVLSIKVSAIKPIN